MTKAGYDVHVISDCVTSYDLKKMPEMFNQNVPYDRIHYFELDKSFDLDAEQYERLMLRGHEVSIITGRPSSVYETSRIWLDGAGGQRSVCRQCAVKSIMGSAVRSLWQLRTGICSKDSGNRMDAYMTKMEGRGS